MQAAVGRTKLKRGLQTDSLVTANQLKWAVIKSLKAEINMLARGESSDDLSSEALALRQDLQSETDKQQLDEQRIDDIHHVIRVRADEIAGLPVEERDERTGEPILVYDSAREAQAGHFIRLATGQSTPLRSYFNQWQGQSVRTLRVMKDDERALSLLQAWCRIKHFDPAIETLTRKAAGQFVAHLFDEALALKVSGGMGRSNLTINKYLSSLSAYWKWLKLRGHVDDNVWRGQSLPKRKLSQGTEPREFTDDEVRELLNGDTETYLHAIMRIAALTGARIDPIVSLKVSDCRDGVFRFKPQKKEKSVRLVPIHSKLKLLVRQLCEDKSANDDLFAELPLVPSGSERERSMPAVKLFGRYRKRLGIDETFPGTRRSRVTFHSFRRWFITKAEQAGQQKTIIEAVVGHKRQGMSLGHYSGGPSLDQFRDCVEAVRLPPGIKPKKM
jgi:integrase